ncbi:hypothetical protein Halhy_1107 [Haliscomenobacter hydrossis DSM 1100]|uniref:Uncharacterized protein n=1 Tax=Haliscomenobacter hydrossis (strain ATCC 27775 / DSM 1100 / LMG 10767 / O) TaxID=760192 RepID=F4KRL6_HALH1|nr:hypothetical protein Halhy_1107 [Haliscomenobacter hydrossis DSM 1100]
MSINSVPALKALNLEKFGFMEGEMWGNNFMLG